MTEYKEEGIVVRGLGGAFTVRTDAGAYYTCRAKGVLKRNDGKLLVGDRVTLSRSEDGQECVVSEILARRCALIRPPLANVTVLVLVMAGAYPAPSLPTADRLLAICAHEGIEPVIVLTKSDLAKAENEALCALYRDAGYEVYSTCATTGAGTDVLRAALSEKLRAGGIAAFAGASGVGKSTLLCALFPSLALETGALSEKTARGRHTTRHVELFDFSGGFVADTPGFSLLDFEHFDFFSLDDLFDAFPDFAPYRGACRYDDCTHVKEEGCALLDAVREGRVAPSRHETYAELYAILKTKKSTYPKR
ncbi:MAG: ribosome small subunit-dependent GTPase A [Clostridia bacterium]|nr:ribosome small subunit-dependent GTPase A [Clostridia bacterium]